jgi:hypothetical protein
MKTNHRSVTPSVKPKFDRGSLKELWLGKLGRVSSSERPKGRRLRSPTPIDASIASELRAVRSARADARGATHRVP